jgi:predicted AAA+ superfamily ATPase
LFKKEHEIFMDFLRTLAMGIGDLYKEERIAKLMNISRRKVRKYTEILLEHKMIFALGPLVLDHETELSRHVKIYFSDLSSYAQILGAAYGHGYSKK